MSSFLFAEISATCNSLGYSDGIKYCLDPQCEEAVKDLIRYLRRDDENHEIRRHLGDAKILQTDLLPILKEHWERSELFDHVLRLLVNLTYPALVLYNAELPVDKTARYYYLQIISHLQSYKEAFIDDVVWAVLCKKLGSLLNIEWQDRSEDEGKIIERILTLVRNVLQVPADYEAEKRPDNDATIHDQVLWALYQSGMVGLLHYIISSKDEDKYHMHVLEIISQMLRDQNPSFLAQAEAVRSIIEKSRDEAELLAVRQREAQEHHEKIEKYTGLRDTHGEKPRIKNYWGNRFTGTYVVKGVKSIGDSDMVYHKPLASLASLELNHDKKLVKKPKNKRPPVDTVIERRSTLSVRLFLKEFCIEFLNGAYNTLMYSVREMIHHGKNQVNDESYYLWAMKFFMEFNRNYKAEMKLISETVSLSSFHFIHTQIETYNENMLGDKKKIFIWGRRMHLALRAYQELLLTLCVMDRSSDPGIRESARIIKCNMFYVVEYRELILYLIINFHESKYSKSYLKDLIETVHIFLKLLEEFCSRSRGIIVQQKQRVRRQKKKRTNKSKENQQTVELPNAESLWNDIEIHLTTVIENQSEIPNEIVPFDVTSEVPIDEQKIDAVKKIQTALREKQLPNAVGLLRASREVWPENDSFGSSNSTPEEEVLALKEIFFADLGQPFTVSQHVVGNQESENEENEEEEEEEEDDHGGREINENFSEKTFQFMDFVKRFCNPNVLQACGVLLRSFHQNAPKTNHCVLKLLHRIAWDCKMPAMIFQASIFRTFQKILQSGNPQHKELKKFAIFIIRKFVEIAQKNPKVYMELLFWKHCKEANEIEFGYGTFQSESQASKKAWTEEEEDELRRLFEEYMALHEKPSEGDIIDWILRNLISDSRSRRGVSKKLSDMGYAVPKSKPARRSVSTRPPVEWSSEEESQITELFHRFKGAYDPLGCIVDHLTVKRPKSRVVEKLLAMGLVEDKKDLRKKRSKKNQNDINHPESSGDESAGNSTDSESASGENDSDVDTNHVVPTVRNKQKTPRNSTSRKKGISKQQKTSNFSQDEALKLKEQVRSAGMSEALEWLAESLEEIAEDAGDGSEESTPLVPLLEPCMCAMDSPLFQQFLKALGINPPADEQECYWRVPGHLTAEKLRTLKEIIEREPTSESLLNTEDFDQLVAEDCRRIITECEKEVENEGSEQDILPSSTSPSTPQSMAIVQTQSTQENPISCSPRENSISDHSENESYVPELSISHTEEAEGEAKISKTKRKFKRMVDSEESEDEVLPDVQEIAEEESAVTKRMRMLDSDSEPESTETKKHRKVLLLSDDED